MNYKLLLKILLVAGILTSALFWLQPYIPGEKAENHIQPKLPNSIHTLPMDSSIVIIFETTGLLKPSCIPGCWPRDFSQLPPSEHYTAYIQKRLYNREIAGRTNFEKSKRVFPEVDSSFYSLIDDAMINYEIAIKGKIITIENVRVLNNKRVKIGLIDGLTGKFADNELGYIQLSPVITNERGDKGVFFYERIGEIMVSYLVCVQKVNGKWLTVSNSRMAIS